MFPWELSAKGVWGIWNNAKTKRKNHHMINITHSRLKDSAGHLTDLVWRRFLDLLSCSGSKPCIHQGAKPLPSCGVDLPPGEGYGELILSHIRSVVSTASALLSPTSQTSRWCWFIWRWHVVLCFYNFSGVFNTIQTSLLQGKLLGAGVDGQPRLEHGHPSGNDALQKVSDGSAMITALWSLHTLPKYLLYFCGILSHPTHCRLVRNRQLPPGQEETQ